MSINKNPLIHEKGSHEAKGPYGSVSLCVFREWEIGSGLTHLQPMNAVLLNELRSNWGYLDFSWRGSNQGLSAWKTQELPGKTYFKEIT